MRKERSGAVLWSSVFVTLLCGHFSAAQPASAPENPYPIIGQFDSSQLDLSSPRVFFTADELAKAKAHCAADSTCAAMRDRIVVDAEAAMAVKAAPLDESWWQVAKSKPWQDTYPDVYLHTGKLPAQQAIAAFNLAFAGQLAGKDTYLDRSHDILMALSDYSFAPEHFDVGMNYATWCCQFLRAYDLIAVRLTADQRARLDACMTRAAEAVLKNDEYWIKNNIGGGINNHLAWHKMLLGMLGLFYDRPDLVAYAMHGPRGMIPLLADGLVDDGLWCESSLTYQFTAIVPMLMLSDCQQRVNAAVPGKFGPALHEITAANGRTLKSSFDAMFHVLAPDTMIPPIGDTYGARTRLWKVPAYEYAWKLWHDPAYAWLLQQNPELSAYMLTAPPIPASVSAPPVGSILLPEHGYAFLRSHRDAVYWNNPEAACAFLTYDRSNVHANADKLSLMLFGLNRMLLSDVEGRCLTTPHAFSSPIQGQLNRGGLSQNTVMIDGANQRCAGEMLDLIEFRDVPADRRVTAADRRGILYPGVRQMRTISMTPDYVLDVFQVDCGERPRQIDWIAHVMDEKAAAPAEINPLYAAGEPFEFPPEDAYKWLRQPRSVASPGPIWMEWRDGLDRLGLRMLEQPYERVIFCGYPATDEPNSCSVPMMMVRTHATRATFVAVWLIGSRTPHVDVRQLPDHEGKLVYEVTANGQRCRHMVSTL